MHTLAPAQTSYTSPPTISVGDQTSLSPPSSSLFPSLSSLACTLVGERVVRKCQHLNYFGWVASKSRLAHGNDAEEWICCCGRIITPPYSFFKWKKNLFFKKRGVHMEEYCVLVLGKVPRLSVVKQSSSIQRSKNRADLVFNVAPRTCRRATKTMVGQLGTHCARVFRIFFQDKDRYSRHLLHAIRGE